MLFTSKMSLEECRQELKLSLVSNQIYGKVFAHPFKKDECYFLITNRKHLLLDTRAPSHRLPILVACSGKIRSSKQGADIQARMIYGIAGSPILMTLFLLIVFCMCLFFCGGKGFTFEMTMLCTAVITLAFSVVSAILSKLSNLGDEDQYEIESFLRGNLKATQVK